MAKPIISLLDSTNTNIVEEWSVGVVKANSSSSILEVNVWNNKGGTTEVADLREASVTCLDGNGGTTGDVSVGKWLKVLVGTTADTDNIGNKLYTAVGGSSSAPLRAQTVPSSSGNIIKGSANDGTANSGNNYCNCKFRFDVPINANKGTYPFKIQVRGYSV